MISMARVWRIVEIVIGFLVPLFVAGPFIVIGLIVSILILLQGDPTILMLSLCGAFGLFGIGSLLFGENLMSRRRAELSTAGILAGIAPIVWLLGRRSILSQLWHFDQGGIIWTAVLIPPVILGLRRVVLLWKNPPPDSH